MSPLPDSGLGGALRVGADLWLMAHGADLVRDGTLSGVAAPIGVTPLLLSVLPAWLLHRGAASAVGNGSPRAAGWLLTGYVGIALPVTVYAATGPVHVNVLSAALHVPLFAAAATAAGAWTGCGRPSPARYVRWGGDAALALRAGGMAAAVLVAGGAIIGGVALAEHLMRSGRAYGQLSAPIAGQVAVFLLCVLLVPNLAVWSAAYALGPGFAVGAGSAVSPAGASGYPLLPRFPLLAALPPQGPAHALGWATLAVPALASVAVAVCCVRGRRPPGRTALVAAGGSAVCGLALGLLAYAAAGPMGTATLADFGPGYWLTAAAATAWPLVLATLPATAVAWLRTRALREPPPHPAPRWARTRATWRWTRAHLRRRPKPPSLYARLAALTRRRPAPSDSQVQPPPSRYARLAALAGVRRRPAPPAVPEQPPVPPKPTHPPKPAEPPRAAPADGADG
ncbi:hypothetical protein HCN08_05125 [Streptomyces sp. PRB2-1]|uniref:Integral membrane protein n=1 Tax=Actinacidiphila epipremni TaxID=2053013 RepID=A0ABX0ZME3_9ACTN|nr:hypothetical protein [Actinacidiphila epipremni]